MELKEFVKETLLQIITGVKEAQEALVQYGAVINPAYIKEGAEKSTPIDNKMRVVQDVLFEVALASSSGEATKSGIGVMLASIGGGVNKSIDEKSTFTTGITFSVPISRHRW